MSNEPNTVTIEQVRRLELEDIVVRRQQQSAAQLSESADTSGANAAPAAATPIEPQKVSQDLVGIALSGGGLRSAFFNMGFTRALHRVGVFRLADYLSTVSGGGYVGSLLSAASLRRKTPFGRKDFPVEAEAATATTAEASSEIDVSHDFLCSGGYLRRPWVLFNKYLIGLFFINVAVFSGLIALCSIVAYAWRLLDLPWVRDRLYLIGFDSDLIAPFLPLCGFMVAWVIAWAISYWRRGAEAPGWLAQRLLYLIVASLLIAMALLIGNGDTSLGALQSWFDKPYFTFQRNLRAPLLMLVLGALLPLLNPKRIIESGVRPKQKWHRWIFGTVTLGLLVGVPLALTAFLARENVSGFATFREPDLLKEDIKDTVQGWRQFCNLLIGTTDERKDSTSRPVPSWAKLDTFDPRSRESDLKRIKQELASYPGAIAALEDSDPTKMSAYFSERLNTLKDKLDEQVRYEQEINGPMGTWHAWNDYAPSFHTFYLVVGSLFEDNVVRKYWAAKRSADALEDEVCAILSGVVLTEPAMYQDPAFQQISRELLTEVNFGNSTEVKSTLKTVNKTPDVHGVRPADPARGIGIPDTAAIPGDLGMLSNDSVRAFLERKKTDLKEGPEFVKLWREARETEADNWPWHTRKQFNRLLLEAHYPELFEQRTDIRRRIVIYEDQSARLGWLLWSLLIFLVAGAWVDVNSTSMHRFYRDQLAGVFIRPQERPNRRIMLSDLATTDRGAPYHLISASVSLPHRSLIKRPSEKSGTYRETRPQSSPFLFSRRFCGSDVTGYAASQDYENRLLDSIDLADAMALSGAAVTPGQINNWLIAFLMFIFNLRLGQWLPNPRSGTPRFRARILLWFVNNWFAAKERPYVFIADGGYSENLGVLPLLQRRCRLIIAADASCDPNYQFADLSRLIEYARLREHIIITELSQSDLTGQPSDLRTKLIEPISPPGSAGLEQDGAAAKKRGLSPQHFLLARIHYPATATEPASDGLLVYVKPSFDGDEGLPLTQYCSVSPQFPHEPSSDQDYDVSQADAYCRLGEHIGLRIARVLPGRTTAPQIPDLWDRRDVTATQLIDWFEQLAAKPAEADKKPQGQAATDGDRADQEPGRTADHDRDSLIRKLSDPDPTAREFAATRLGANGFLSEPAITALIQSLNDRYLEVRRAARYSLYNLRAVALHAVVDGAVNPGNSVRMRRQCAWIIREWANDHEGPAFSMYELRSRLHAAADRANDRVRGTLVEAIEALDGMARYRRARHNRARRGVS